MDCWSLWQHIHTFTSFSFRIHRIWIRKHSLHFHFIDFIHHDSLSFLQEVLGLHVGRPSLNRHEPQHAARSPYWSFGLIHSCIKTIHHQKIISTMFTLSLLTYMQLSKGTFLLGNISSVYRGKLYSSQIRLITVCSNLTSLISSFIHESQF